MSIRVFKNCGDELLVAVTHGNRVMEFSEKELSAYLDKIYDDIPITKMVVRLPTSAMEMIYGCPDSYDMSLDW